MTYLEQGKNREIIYRIINKIMDGNLEDEFGNYIEELTDGKISLKEVNEWLASFDVNLIDFKDK